MGNSGFDIIESFDGGKNLNTDWFTSDFTLPDDFPPQLQTFFHLKISLSESSIVSIIEDGVSYPINNGTALVGIVYRSIPIIKGVTYNVQCDTTQTTLKTTLSLEQ